MTVHVVLLLLLLHTVHWGHHHLRLLLLRVPLVIFRLPMLRRTVIASVHIIHSRSLSHSHRMAHIVMRRRRHFVVMTTIGTVNTTVVYVAHVMVWGLLTPCGTTAAGTASHHWILTHVVVLVLKAIPGDIITVAAITGVQRVSVAAALRATVHIHVSMTHYVHATWTHSHSHTVRAHDSHSSHVSGGH